MLELRDINVTIKKGIFKKQRADILQNISFKLHKGSSLGIIGKSGSGKSSIAGAILKLLPVHSGDILIEEKSIFHNCSRLELAKKVQLITQNPDMSFDPDMTIYNSFKEVANIHKLLPQSNDLSQLISGFLQDLNLKEIDLHKLPKYYSGGELQRFSIIRALLIRPKIIIFDEADSMLDTSIRVDLLQTISNIRKKYSITYIYITHDIRVLPQITEDVIILDNGKITEYGSVNILKESQNPFIQQLRNAITLK